MTSTLPHHRRKLLMAGLLGASAVALGMGVWFAQNGLQTARKQMANNQWAAARRNLGYYRWLHPWDDRARIMLAEAWIKDDALDAPRASDEALKLLRQVDDRTLAGVQARVQEARILLFIQRKASRAEEVLRHAMELDKNDVESRYLLWKLLDLTGRSDSAEPLVWEVVELTPPNEQPIRLREWYMSQFYPAAANPVLDRLMGIMGEEEQPSSSVAQRRFQAFRDAEPDRALGHAALAHWFIAGGQPQFALELLALAETQITPDQRTDPLLISAYVAAHVDLGNFEKAEFYFRQWPEPHEGYEYWRWKGVMEDEVHANPAAAVQAYDRALAQWPGPADWRTLNRKVNCLRTLGRIEEAERERERALKIEKMMETSLHEQLRAALARLDAPSALLRVAEFYRDLGRPREAAAWLRFARERQVDNAPPTPRAPR